TRAGDVGRRGEIMPALEAQRTVGGDVEVSGVRSAGLQDEGSGPHIDRPGVDERNRKRPRAAKGRGRGTLLVEGAFINERTRAGDAEVERVDVAVAVEDRAGLVGDRRAAQGDR